jgi:hypothetical protein
VGAVALEMAMTTLAPGSGGAGGLAAVSGAPGLSAMSRGCPVP